MSWAIWFTGPSGRDTAAVANALRAALEARGQPAGRLELATLGKVLTPTPTDSAWEQELVHRALVYLARTLVEHRVPVILDAPAHRADWRRLARAVIPHFAEVQIVGSPESPYEPASDPEVVVETVADDPSDAAASILPIALDLIAASPPVRPPNGSGWAVWITGPPGSGKTTLAAALAERLMALGLDVALLDLLDARGFLLGDRPGLPAEEEILHRVLVCAARLLAEAGVPVIIDATAPRRAWRRLARAEICRFAEVQLVCPRELCAERERAVRWSIGTRGHPAHHRVATPGPEIAIDYETSPEAELIVHTDVRDLTSEVDEILMLTLRLRRRAPADRDRS